MAAITTITIERDALRGDPGTAGARFHGLAQRCAGGLLELDLTHVQIIEGYALGLLIRLHKDMRSSGGRLLLRNLTAPVRELLQIVRLDRYFEYVREDPEVDPCLVVGR